METQRLTQADLLKGYAVSVSIGASLGVCFGIGSGNTWFGVGLGLCFAFSLGPGLAIAMAKK